MTIREKILVIEDEKSISHFISTVLNNNGYEAMQAQTGEEALSMIDRSIFRRSGSEKMTSFLWLSIF